MKIKYRINLAAGIFGIVLAAIVFVLIPRQIGVEYVISYGINSRSLPYAIAGCIGICGLVLVIQSLVLKKDKEKVIEIKKEIAPFLIMLGFIVYIFTFEKDWLICTAALGCLTLAVSKCKKWYYYAIVIALTVALYIIFVNVFHIRLKSLIF